VLASVLVQPDLDADPMAQRILDASLAQLLDFGVRRFSVEDVARRVGINRITIYRRFSGKDGLLRAVILREGGRIFAAVDTAIASLGSPEAQLVEGFALGFMGVRRHPLIQRMLATERDMIAMLVMNHGGAIVAFAREYLAGHARAAQRIGALEDFDPTVVAELAIRLSLSLLLTPESAIPLEDEDDARRFAIGYLVPTFELSRSAGKPARTL
jgi:AcrR family transcriptional regulator